MCLRNQDRACFRICHLIDVGQSFADARLYEYEAVKNNIEVHAMSSSENAFFDCFLQVATIVPATRLSSVDIAGEIYIGFGF